MIFIFLNSNRKENLTSEAGKKFTRHTIATGWVQWVQCR